MRLCLQSMSFFLTLEDLCEPMLESLLQTIIPRLDRTLQEVASPICDGFASTWEYFQETCDEIIELGSKSSSEKNIKIEVIGQLQFRDVSLSIALYKLLIL